MSSDEFDAENLSIFRHDLEGYCDRVTDIISVQKIDQFELVENDNGEANYSINFENIKLPVLEVSKLEPILMGVNLLEGFKEDLEEKILFEDKMNAFLEVLLARDIDPFKYDFVSLSGVFHAIMKAPIHSHHEWMFVAAKLRNTIFFKEFKDPVLGYMGNTAPHSGREPNMNRSLFEFRNLKRLALVVNKKGNREEVEEKRFFGVLESKLCSTNYSNDYDFPSFNLLYASQLFALKNNKTLDMENLRNYTTFRLGYSTQTEKQKYDHQHYKYPQWWALAKLTGQEKIVVVNRGLDRKVDGIKEMLVDSMPRRCEPGGWKGDQRIDLLTMNYFYRFLEHVKRTLKDETDPGNAYLFYHSTISTQVTCQKLSDRNSLFTDRFLAKFK